MNTTSVTSVKTYLDFDGLSELKGSARQDSQAALRETAQQFEAMFIQQMLKSMRASIEKSDLTDNTHVETFENLFDKEVAMKLAKRGGIGLAEMLVKSMKSQPADRNTSANTLDTPVVDPQGSRAFPLNPKLQGLPLVDPIPRAIPLRSPNALPLNLPPKPFGVD